jgi:hypothetical protein
MTAQETFQFRMIKRLKAKRTSQTDVMTKTSLQLFIIRTTDTGARCEMHARLLADCDIYALRKELSVND